MDQKSLGNIMRHYRKSHGLTQRKFSKLVGCSYSTMSKVEAGKQAAKSKLVLNILATILPDFKSQLLLIEAEAECLERRNQL